MKTRDFHQLSVNFAWPDIRLIIVPSAMKSEIFEGIKQVKKTKPRSLRRAGFQKNQFLLRHEAALLRLFPEGTGLADFFHALDHLAGIFMYV